MEGRQSISTRAALVSMAALSLGAFAAFSGLAHEVAGGTTTRFDVALLSRIHALFPGWLDLPMVAVTTLGYYSVVIVILLIVAYLFHREGLRMYALFLSSSALGDMALATIAKDTVDRMRPHLFHFANYPIPSSYSFPSGHANMAVAFYGVLSLLVALRSKGWRRRGVLILGAVLVLLIGFSRLYLGVHYPSDVLGGYLLGASWAAAVGVVFTLWRSRRGPGERGRG